MNYDMLERFRRRLLRRKQDLTARRQATVADEDALLSEHPPDWVDQAGLQTAAEVLDKVSDSERDALTRIKTSLDRMAVGRYGECARCHRDIDGERLRAVPDTELCARCAGR